MKVKNIEALNYDLAEREKVRIADSLGLFERLTGSRFRELIVNRSPDGRIEKIQIVTED